MKKGDKVRILNGEYTDVIATVASVSSQYIELILPLEYVPDGESVPYWSSEVEKINDES